MKNTALDLLNSNFEVIPQEEGKPLRVKLQYAFSPAELVELKKVFQDSNRHTPLANKIFERIERAI